MPIRLFALVVIASLTAQSLSAQSLSISFGAGMGKSYIVETLETQLDLFGPAYTMNSEIQFQPKDSKYAIVAEYVGMQTTTNFFPGDVRYMANTISAKICRVFSFDSPWTLGVGGGIGATSEDVHQFWPTEPLHRRFVTISMSSYVNRNLGEHMMIGLRINALWFDPITTFMPAHWVTGGEDINSLLSFQLGWRL